MPEKKSTPTQEPDATTAASPEAPATYEAARDELIDTVRQLEAGGTTLEESIALWERGETLAEACQQWLDGARARLDTTTPDEASTRAPARTSAQDE